MDEADREAEAKTQSRKRRLWWILALPALLVVAVAFGVWRKFDWAHETIARHAARVPAERAAFAAMRRGRPALLEPAAAGEANAVVQAFLAAFEAVPEPEREKVVGYQPDPVPPEEIDAVLASHPEVLAALEPLLAVPSVPLPPPVDPAASGDWLGPRMVGSTWLSVAADRALARGDAKAATRIAVLTAAYGHEIARDGTLGASLVATSVEILGTRRLVVALGGGIDEDEARRAGAALHGLEATRTPPSIVLAGERASIRSHLASPGPDLRLSLGRRADYGFRRLWSPTVYRAEALDGWDDAMDAMVPAVLGSEKGALVAIARGKAAASVEHPLLAAVLQSYSIWIKRREMARAWALVARTACAVSEATAHRGALPKTLEELVPEFLPAVPIDPWSGKPLRYEEGRVWSFGPDGVDDGGAPVDLSEANPPDLAARVPAPR